MSDMISTSSASLVPLWPACDTRIRFLASDFPMRVIWISAATVISSNEEIRLIIQHYIQSDPSSGGSNDSSPKQMTRNNPVDVNSMQGNPNYHMSSYIDDTRQQTLQTPVPIGQYASSIPPQIVIPRARHNQVNYAVHRGQVSLDTI